jgi:hypothetical protein
MLPVLDLDPMLARAALIRTVTPLGDQSLQSHVAGDAEKIGTDFAARTD